MDKCSSTQERFSFRVLYRLVFMLHYRPPHEKLADVFRGKISMLCYGAMGCLPLLSKEMKKVIEILVIVCRILPRRARHPVSGMHLQET
jgi:hypothetical protein